MNRHRPDDRRRPEDFDARWYLAPVSVVVLAIVLLQVIEGLRPTAGPADRAATPMPPLSAEFPSVAEPPELPANLAKAEPAAPVASTVAAAGMADTNHDLEPREDNHAATF